MNVTLNKSFLRIGIIALTVAIMAGNFGCSKTQSSGVGQDVPKTEADIDAKLQEVVKKMDAAKEPYKGNLTPDKAAAITHEVSQQSMAEFPSGKNLPKDPKKLMALNEKIREKSEKIYSKNGTTMGEMMRYISGLSPKDREKYNNHLTELFLEQSKKKYGTNKPKDVNKDKPVEEKVPKPKETKKKK